MKDTRQPPVLAIQIGNTRIKLAVFQGVDPEETVFVEKADLAGAVEAAAQLYELIGAESDAMRAQESQKLLNWGFMNFQSFKIYSKDQPVLTPVVWKGSRNQVRLGFNRDVYVSLPRGSTARLKSVVERTDPLFAPIAQHSPVGKLSILADGKIVSELPLLALDQINTATIFGRTYDSLRLLFPH
jgi:D-alanyl-D-alanine carboxypeptidase (penicillin-binding protein 5/6)